MPDSHRSRLARHLSPALCGGVLIASLMSACGSSAPGEGAASVAGTIRGQSFSATTAATFESGPTQIGDANGPTINGAFVYIADVGSVCSDAANVVNHPNSAYFGFLLADGLSDGGTAPPSAPAVYDASGASAAHGVLGTYVSFNASCEDVSEATGASTGTVTLTTVSNTEFAGTFDLMFTASDITTPAHVTGSFTAPRCSASPDGLGGALACE